MTEDNVFWTLFALAGALILYIYLDIRKRYNYWKRKSVAYLEPTLFVGNLLPVFRQQCSIGDIYNKAYEAFPKEKVVGIYEIMNPVLIVRDPKLLERILVKDFNHFVDHGNMLSDGLFANGLFQLKGTTWRSLRYKMSPAFTSGKLKTVFNGMMECTNDMINLMNENLYKDFEVQNALITFTIDVIASTVFGIQINDIIAREEFAKQGTSIFNLNFYRYVQMLFLTQFPRIAKILGFKSLKQETEDYFRSVIKRTFEQRLQSNNQRNDYLNHLIKLKEKRVIEVQTRDEDDAFLELDKIQPPPENVEITDDIIASQAFQFLTAGFDPLFNAIMLVMYEMSLNPKAQELARQEVKEALRNNSGYSYKALKEMTYLEQCVQESLRLHPLVPFLMRTCTKKYVTDFGLEIEKGQKLIIPLNALHKDAEHFTDPEAFIPERQPPGTLKSNFTYLPFGDGPRMCIGLRFAIVEVKLALARILENFKFTLSPKTKVPLELCIRAFIFMPKHKLLFNLSPA
ncbi:hypothetical protein O3M35_007212 [Rhynocoris fuscipes]|uniref:Cytochrome P450 n=1 Tax=Rhynocoris fuscipes TaxID=488301 RepID=A0AAW1DDV8_9HEMI